MADLTVILALASPLVRARLRASLSLAGNVRVVDEAASAAQVIKQIIECRPQLVLCDRQMLADPGLAALGRHKTATRLVLVTVNSEAVPPRAVVPVAGTLPFTLPTGEMAGHLQNILSAPEAVREPLARPPAPELGHRFTMGNSVEMRPANVPDQDRTGFQHASPPPVQAPTQGQAVGAGAMPIPTTAALLKQTSFLKSVFDAPASREEGERSFQP